MTSLELRSMAPEADAAAGEAMLHEDRWEEIRRLRFEEHRSVSAIARLLDLDRKTVRRCLRDTAWRPYTRAPRTDTLLVPHAEFLRQRAPEVQYSAQILFQELRRQQGYRGGYDTVRRFVAPLRQLASHAELCQTRFETPPGEQSQIDWGEVGTELGRRSIRLHIFVLTLGFSRRGFYWASPDERLPQFLEAHERAFEHFGGHTREHLYDRPRIVCRPAGEGRFTWNRTFLAFAQYWSFEPRVCRAYRAQTKGKVESGVKYVKRNFMPGRRFLDIVDFQAQLEEWNATIADPRIHGTTHVPPLERFAEERAHLVPVSGHPSFRLRARQSRIVASDYLVSFDTHRYSVPFALIGQTVEVEAPDDQVRIFHRGQLVATHPRLAGQHQFHILPEHGPGALQRTQRRQRPSPFAGGTGPEAFPEVEIRDLALYDSLAHRPAPEVIP
jgi:transposase